MRSLSGIFTLILFSAISATAGGLKISFSGEKVILEGGSVAGSGKIEVLPEKQPLNAFAVHGDQPLAVNLDFPLAEKGTVMFWLHFDRHYQSGMEEQEFSQKILELPSFFSLSFASSKIGPSLAVNFIGSEIKTVQKNIDMSFPKLPGPGWHHLALCWDSRTGLINVFLDGTPYFSTDYRVDAWQANRIEKLLLFPSRFALAGFQITPEALPEAALAAIAENKKGALDSVLGAADLGNLPETILPGKQLYACPMADASEVEQWKLEGPGKVEYSDGWTTIKSLRPEGPDGHVVLWCPETFPNRFIAKWDFELLNQAGLGIVFFAASGKNDRDLFDSSLAKRDGTFRQYIKGDIDCYHISYFANTPHDGPRPVANLRKNAGFYLVANGPVGVPVSKWNGTHQAVLIKDGAHIQMFVDGRKIIDYVDDGKQTGPILKSGKIGLRQMQWTIARYRNFVVNALP